MKSCTESSGLHQYIARRKENRWQNAPIRDALIVTELERQGRRFVDQR
jgi:hypothetical protein